MASEPPASAPERPLIGTMRRFLPYLWPADAPGLRVRIVIALLLVVLSKIVQVYGAPFALQGRSTPWRRDRARRYGSSSRW